MDAGTETDASRPGDGGRENSVETNLAYQEEPWREELIDGKLIAMAPPVTNHNRVKLNISNLFWNYLRGKRCEVLPDGEAAYLTDLDYYIPDVMVVCDPEKVKEDGVHGAPDLVVEVLSPGTVRYDRGRKMQIYEASGVREYWLVNPADKVVEQYLLKDGKLVLSEVYALRPEWELRRMKPEERASVVTEFKCSLYEDLSIRLEDVFDRVR